MAALLWLLLVVTVPAPAIALVAPADDAGPAPAPPAQTAGVQVHLLWEHVDRAEAARQLERAAASGAGLVRVDVGWASLEQRRDGRWSRWALRRLDAVVAGARARGLRALLTVFGTPCWASSAPARLRRGCRGRWWTRGVERYAPRRAADYASALAFLVHRYGRHVAAWEVWNEPNQRAFFAARDPAVAYARLLRAAYRAVKAVDPGTTVVGGALAGADDRFTERLERLGVRGAFDAWSVHPYSHDRSPLDRRTRTARRYSFVRGVPAVRRALLRHGDDKPLWLTEIGWSTAGARGRAPWANGVDLETQARFLTQAFRQVRTWDYVAVAVWYALADTTADPADLVGNFGLLRRDGSPKPSFNAFRRAAVAMQR